MPSIRPCANLANPFRLGSLNKFYGDMQGNHLGSSQGVGFSNELIARMTSNRARALADQTSVNHTLDASTTTFPLDRVLYADFSHDDPSSSIYAALGIFNNTAMLSNTTYESLVDTKGYSAATTVPFAGRGYFEHMVCKADGAQETYVRLIINDAVQPLVGCGADSLGRCTLSAFVDAQAFSAQNGLWNQC